MANFSIQTPIFVIVVVATVVIIAILIDSIEPLSHSVQPRPLTNLCNANSRTCNQGRSKFFF